MVKSEQVYSPENYICAVTGNYYFFKHDITPIREIQYLLAEHECDLWDYPLTEIDHIVENNLDVVLVDVSRYSTNGEWISEYRWFEVPEDFEEMEV